MNAQRRKALSKIQSEAEELDSQLSELKAKAQELAEQLTELKDEEQEAFDNMPESLQQSERGQTAEAAVSAMESAIEALEDVDNWDLDLSGIEEAQS